MARAGDSLGRREFVCIVHCLIMIDAPAGAWRVFVVPAAAAAVVASNAVELPRPIYVWEQFENILSHLILASEGRFAEIEYAYRVF